MKEMSRCCNIRAPVRPFCSRHESLRSAPRAATQHRGASFYRKHISPVSLPPFLRPPPCRSEPPASPTPSPPDEPTHDGDAAGPAPADASDLPADKTVDQAAAVDQTVADEDEDQDEDGEFLPLNPIQELIARFEFKPPTKLQLGVAYVSYVLNFAIQAVALVTYVSFWWLLTGSVWERTGSAWALSIPLAVVTFNDWAVLKVLVTCYFATALSAWPLVIGKLVIDYIHHIHSHDLKSFPRSIRVLAAVLGRNLRAPVMANYTWLAYTQQELSGFEPITGPLSDNTDTTVFKWQSLWDIVWTVGVLWFLYAHIVVYESNWGDLFKGTGFTYARLGSWHMPEFPAFWKPVVGGPSFVATPGAGGPSLWGPFPVT